MKNKKILGISALVLGGTLGILGKTRSLKASGFVAAGIGGVCLFREIFKEEKQKVEVQAEATERELDKTGLNVEVVDDFDLFEQDFYAKKVLQEIYKSAVFPDEMLVYNSSVFNQTLHVMQHPEKPRVIISIPLPNRSRKGLTPRDVKEYFNNFFREFIDREKISMPPYTNHIGVHVGVDDGYYYFTEIERMSTPPVNDGDEGWTEPHKDYINRIESIITAWESGDEKRMEPYKRVNETDTIRFEQYLNIELPLFSKEQSDKKGVDLLLITKLLNELVSTHQVYCKNLNKDLDFEFKRILFHPENDYGVFYLIDEDTKEIVEVEL